MLKEADSNLGKAVRGRSRTVWQQKFAQVLVRALVSREALAVLIGVLLGKFAQRFYDWWLKRRRVNWQRLWRRHVDFSDVQACILTTEHLQSLGRVEKRTLFVKPISEVFRNEYILSQVLETAEKAAASGEPMLVPLLSAEDKWHVLTTCANHLSSCFAPYHVFFNEARRTESFYKSAWYCFTLTCAQTSSAGRWFITPRNPVGAEDVGMLRIRILMMNEQEVREVAAGAVEPPSFGFFNGRHESRWKVIVRFSELFGRQVRRVTGMDVLAAESSDWGPNLCGKLASRKHGGSNVRLASLEHAPVPEYEPEDNAVLRIHIPFPSAAHEEMPDERRQEECVSKDVVLFE